MFQYPGSSLGTVEVLRLDEWMHVAFVASIGSAGTMIATSVDHADGSSAGTDFTAVSTNMSPSPDASALSARVGINAGQQTPDVFIDEVSLEFDAK
jgi:hypothetical protein